MDGCAGIEGLEVWLAERWFSLRSCDKADLGLLSTALGVTEDCVVDTAFSVVSTIQP